MEDLRKCHGEKFRCKICGTAVQGAISVAEENIYLCQDKMDGTDAFDKLGYKYSWLVPNPSRVVGWGWEESLASENVSDFELLSYYTEIIETTHFLTI